MAKLAAGHAALTPRGNVLGPRSSRVPNRTRTAPRSAGRSSYTLRAARPCADVRVWCACGRTPTAQEMEYFFFVKRSRRTSPLRSSYRAACPQPHRPGASGPAPKIEGRNSVARGNSTRNTNSNTGRHPRRLVGTDSSLSVPRTQTPPARPSSQSQRASEWDGCGRVNEGLPLAALPPTRAA